MMPYIIRLSDPQADLAAVGGKGASLAKLAQARLPVPGGFHVTTAAYQEFVAVNRLQEHILEALRAIEPAQPSTFETAAQQIRQLFAEAAIPVNLVGPIQQAYASLPGTNPAVAVRSSATAEDLPEASFAGQQETYLNIQGAEAVLDAVCKCWASLWTGRAIAYRLRQGIAPESVALAVVIQMLIPAEAAGVLFTANPLNGRREEMLLNAAWGLGEAVVSGVVTPDTITFDKSSGKVIRYEAAEKQVMTVRTETGTQEQPVPEELRSQPALSQAQAEDLARLGMQIEVLYGMPMDIEWALADGKFAILQARPITALAPAALTEAPLEWKPPRPQGVYMRTSAADLMPDPLSPLFRTMGIAALREQMNPLGERLTHMKPILEEDYFTTINSYAYMNAWFSRATWKWILFGLLPSYPGMLRRLVPFWRDEARPQYRAVADKFRQLDPDGMTSIQLWQAVDEIVDAFGYYTAALMFATMGASAGAEILLTRVYEKLARKEGDPPAPTLLIGWNSLPIQAEKSLYDMAVFCQDCEGLKQFLLKTPTTLSAQKLEDEHAPAGVAVEDWQAFCQRFKNHNQKFGHMVFDLDFAKPLPAELPEPMLEVIKMYLRGEGNNPHERQKASELQRIQTGEAVLSRLKGFKRWAFSKALKIGQTMSEVREDALADIGLGFPVLRHMLHTLGERLVNADAVESAKDIYWLEKPELANAAARLDAGTELDNLRETVSQRKAFWRLAKTATPPPMIPMRKKYMGFDTTLWLAESEANQSGDTIKGVPASPGQVTAPARVLHGPQDFDQMRPGEVLIAGTTTPAWTPLFAMASAVVTDIGGPLSHGSIVAREYGIPAVMGTGVATRRIKNGQTITVDGGKGIVTFSEN